MIAARVVHRQRRLGDVGQLVRVGDFQQRHVLDGLHQVHLAGHLADRAFHLRVAGMADQHDLTPLGGVAPALVMHLGDQRAGGVDHRQAALGGQLLDTLGHAMGAEHGHRAGRHLVQLVDEHRAAGAQILDHMPVMHDLVTDIDRRTVFLQGPFDDLDRPLDTGAETREAGPIRRESSTYSNYRPPVVGLINPGRHQTWAPPNLGAIRGQRAGHSSDTAKTRQIQSPTSTVGYGMGASLRQCCRACREALASCDAIIRPIRLAAGIVP